MEPEMNDILGRWYAARGVVDASGTTGPNAAAMNAFIADPFGMGNADKVLLIRLRQFVADDPDQIPDLITNMWESILGFLSADGFATDGFDPASSWNGNTTLGVIGGYIFEHYA